MGPGGGGGALHCRNAVDWGYLHRAHTELCSNNSRSQRSPQPQLAHSFPISLSVGGSAPRPRTPTPHTHAPPQPQRQQKQKQQQQHSRPLQCTHPPTYPPTHPWSRQTSFRTLHLNSFLFICSLGGTQLPSPAAALPWPAGGLLPPLPALAPRGDAAASSCAPAPAWGSSCGCCSSRLCCGAAGCAEARLATTR